jgi:hypothetical protein
MIFASEDDPNRFSSPEFAAKIPGEVILNLPIVILIFDFQTLPMRIWNFDGPCPPRKLFGLVSEFAVELRHYPKEPVRIPNYYFGEGFALIFAERHRAPTHLCNSAALSMIFASEDDPNASAHRNSSPKFLAK